MLTEKSKFSYITLDENHRVIFMEKDIPHTLKKFEVLVKVSACGIVIPPQHRTSSFETLVTNECKTFGLDVCGVVDCIGSEVKSLQISDRVAGVIPSSYGHCGCGELIVLEEYDLVKLPNEVKAEDVAACIGDCVRAYFALFYSAKITRDDVILVLDGSSPLSNICIQLARYVGARVITAVRSSSEKKYIESCGTQCDIIDLSFSKHGSYVLYDECMKKTDNLGVDVIVDLNYERNGNFNDLVSVDSVISCLTIQGRWITTNAELQLDPPDSKRLFDRCASLCFLNEQALLISKITQGKYQHVLIDATSKLKDDIIRPPTYHIVSFESVSEMLPLLREKNIQKLVVRIS